MKMEELWMLSGLKHRMRVLVVVVVMCLVCQNLRLCWSLNDEGLALLRLRERVVNDPFGALSTWIDDGCESDPCSWFGVECAEGKVVLLNLKDLCLGGTLAPELGSLVHIKSIILRNNSFYGVIPEEIGELKELEMLDLGYNNFSGSLPSNLGNNLSLAILLLDNNELLRSISHEINELKILSEFQVDEYQLSDAAKLLSCNKRVITRNVDQTKDSFRSRLLKEAAVPQIKSPLPSPPSSPDAAHSGHSPPSSPSTRSPAPSPAPVPSPVPAPNLNSPVASFGPPSESPSKSVKNSSANHHRAFILAGVIGGSVLLLISVTGIYFCKSKKVATVKPWATGLSGQLQKAFVTGVPKLNRSELETACEDFSNVIGSSAIGTLYKGTLSNGVEIAVAAVAVQSSKDWSKNLEAQFRKKIDTLSKVNHKNFVNLIGYCEEEKPFTRMMVFEYAPNGTLFEHLHIKEAEHLDWGMRLRVAMGIAYCLDHMHQLTPPISHRNLTSAAVNLTEDYAAKISDLSFWNEIAVAESAEMEHSNTQSAGLESNVYSFGVILFEMLTGRLPYSVDNGSLEDWASDYLRGEQPLKEMVDPTLTSFEEGQVEEIGKVIKSCVHPDPKQRPTMREVTMKLREITSIGQDGATPTLSPLWWAELEIMSADAS